MNPPLFIPYTAGVSGKLASINLQDISRVETRVGGASIITRSGQSIPARDTEATIKTAIDAVVAAALAAGSGVVAATTLSSGISELATAAETTAGSDAVRTITPDALAHSNFGRRVILLPVSDPNGSALTTGDGKNYFRVPAELNGYNLVDVAASVDTTSSSGLPTFQLRRKRSGSDADMLSTKVSIDASETDSTTAATPRVIDLSNDDVATADRIYADCDVAGTGVKGAAITMSFQLP